MRILGEMRSSKLRSRMRSFSSHALAAISKSFSCVIFAGAIASTMDIMALANVRGVNSRCNFCHAAKTSMVLSLLTIESASPLQSMHRRL